MYPLIYLYINRSSNDHNFISADHSIDSSVGENAVNQVLEIISTRLRGQGYEFTVTTRTSHLATLFFSNDSLPCKITILNLYSEPN